MSAYMEQFSSVHFTPCTYFAASLFTFSLPANHGVTEEDHVFQSMCVNGRLNILTGIQVSLVQSIPVIVYSVKKLTVMGRKKWEGEGEGEALEYVFQCCIRGKRPGL